MTIKELRRQRGWTQADLAGIVGISQVSLSQIETFKIRPKGTTKYRLEKVFNTKNIVWQSVPVLYGMISRFVDNRPERAKQLKRYIDGVIEVSNIINLKSKQL